MMLNGQEPSWELVAAIGGLLSLLLVTGLQRERLSRVPGKTILVYSAAGVAICALVGTLVGVAGLVLGQLVGAETAGDSLWAAIRIPLLVGAFTGAIAGLLSVPAAAEVSLNGRPFADSDF